MSTATTAPRFPLRHMQLARAGIAAIAAVMVTFSPDHSATVGLAVFSGFALVTGIIELAAGWQTYPSGRRAVPLTLGVLSVIAGMLAGIVIWRSTTFFFALVITWALVTGLVELIWALRERRAPALRSEARDSLVVGVFTVLLGLSLLLVPAQYALTYRIAEQPQAEYVLTGITIAVGIFGGYAAIIAVFLGIAGFSPRGASPVDTAPVASDASLRHEEGTA